MHKYYIQTLLPVLIAFPSFPQDPGAPEPIRRPWILYFTPRHGAAGTQVTVLGQGLAAASAVALGGVKAAFQVTADYRLSFTVPPGAASGLITVVTPSGTATSSGSFTVDGASQAPTLSDFTPREGRAGTAVTLTGTGFVQDAQVAFNGADSASVTVSGPGQIHATVPAGATTGPITVRTPGGSATSSASFTVQPSPQPKAPTITGFTPSHGVAGTAVAITGTGFVQGATVTFNGTADASAAVASPTLIHATVPAGAATGPITLATPQGTARSSTAFTVQAAPPPPPPPPPSGVNLSIGKWYVNQSVQNLARSIPLVAGKEGLLRVFVQATGTNQAAPDVRITLTGGTPSPWVQTLKAPGATVPTSINEASLGSSWNARVPGAVLASATTLKIELDPAQAAPDANRGDNTLTAPLNAQPVKPFRITVIPVTQQSLAGNVSSGRTLASWVDRLQRMYPIAPMPGGLEVQQGAAFTTQADLNSGSAGWSQLLGELDRKRTAEGSGRYYFGAVNVSYSGGIAGLGYIGAPTALGWDKSGYADGGNYPEVFAHEVGHNFGRQHAPCGLSSTDPGWPSDAAHAEARIGLYGFDAATGALVAPTAKDIMSYCHPNWVSDYTYKAVRDFRATSASAAEERDGEGELAATRCLMVSGRLKDGALTLDPGFTLCTVPALPEGGDYTLEALDPMGTVFLRVPFSPTDVADLPGAAERHFAFALPICAEFERKLLGMRVVSPGGVLATRHGGWASPPLPPTALRLDNGFTRVLWDARVSESAMVRDGRTRRVLAFLSGGSGDVQAEGFDLIVELSNGLTSAPFGVKVAMP